MKQVKTLEELHTLFDPTFPNKLVILKCGAVWCAPCEKSNPLFEDLAEKYNKETDKIALAKVNIEQMSDKLEGLIKVEKIPTLFVLKKRGNEDKDINIFDQFVGGDLKLMKDFINKYAH